ncbi:Tn3 family transposase [Nocardia sp. NBC_00403]|uniref:Tn3 family transposase n=1 Tax=Nocardia sp. NBC_00403 TaxID=2975990 RepID=UPI002E1F2F3C
MKYTQAGPSTIVFCGTDSALTGADREHAEVSMPVLHLRQSALAHINTMLLQAVLEDPRFNDLVGATERRALSPLFWSNFNLYARFRLDTNTCLDLTREGNQVAVLVRSSHLLLRRSTVPGRLHAD